MQQYHSRIGPMSADQLRALMSILEEFRDYPLTPVALALAARLARLEAK